METTAADEARIGEKMRTYSGGWFWPLDPRPWEVKLIDVAHHLACICRWTGAVRHFYSVAQHAVLVARQVPEPLKLPALLHDAAEAYLGDDARPMKGRLYVNRDDGWRQIGEIEDQLLAVIFQALGVGWPTEHDWNVIKDADNLVLATEARDLFDHDPEWMLQAAEVARLPTHVRPLRSEAAEMLFLDEWDRLRN